ncbi:MAG: hypothetical protein ACP5C3_01895 [Methanomicrobiales archaeon]
MKIENKNLYYPKTSKVSGVNVPPMQFLMIDGKGDHNTAQEYNDAIQALLPVS